MEKMRQLLFFLIITTVSSHSFIQLSDIHYDKNYAENSPNNCPLSSTGMRCCRSFSVPKEPYVSCSKWGDYNCDTPFLLVNESLKWVRDNLSFDFVVYTGDSVDHDDLLAFADAYEEIETVNALLDFYFAPKKIYAVLGNHESLVIDQMFPNSSFLSKIAPLYKNFFRGNNEAYTNFMYNGYYVMDNVLGINSLFYDKNNLATQLYNTSDLPSLIDSGGQLSFVKSNLPEVKFLIGHIPMGSAEATQNFTKTYSELLSMYTNVSSFFGHSHENEFRILGDGRNVVYISPSLMPDSHFPGIRQYFYDDSSDASFLLNNMSITDYWQYNLNFTKQLGSDTFVGYDLVYKAKEYYSLDDLLPSSWYNFAEKMRDNDTLFERYYSNYLLNSTSPLCDQNCKNGMLWDILNSTSF